MKTVILSLTFLASVIVAMAQAPEPTSTTGEAAAILNGAREALGGEKRIAAIKTIVASGQTRQLQGDNLVPVEFEINIELPDKYVRTDEIPARESGPNSRGFNGDGLIQSGDAAGGPGPRRGGPPPPSAAPAAPQGAATGGKPPDSAAAGLPTGASGGAAGAKVGPPPSPTLPVKQDFAKLTLGMFATS